MYVLLPADPCAKMAEEIYDKQPDAIDRRTQKFVRDMLYEKYGINVGIKDKMVQKKVGHTATHV